MGYLKNELTGFVPVEQATDIIKMVRLRKKWKLRV